jgi:23S rRNA (uracil1939-C5)-methyltransferase
MGKIIKTVIEKLVFGGQGLGRFGKKIILAWNALPEEEVEINIYKNKKSYSEGIATTILDSSPYRIEPEEEHFLSCSPWQILSWEQENIWKKKIAQETYERIGNLSLFPDFEIIFLSESQFHYRNKMEYSFVLRDDGTISLAFYKRGTHKRMAINFCKLAEPSINNSVKKIISWLNHNAVPVDILKAIILRCNNKREVIAGLFIKENFPFRSYPSLDETLKGFQIHLSNPLSPASVSDKNLYKIGQDFLENNIRGIKLKFGLLSFFQINLPLFKIVLEDILKFLEPNKSIIDYYSGVGAISLPLSSYYKDCTLVDNDEEAIFYAEENIKENQINNCKTINKPAEKVTQLIDKDKIIIFDPPRAGLHKKIIQKLLLDKPFRIIYLSCNLATQARDIQLLQSVYQIKFLQLYNFFPRTPHIETLCVLERKF